MILSSQAAVELQDSYDWYEFQKVGLGERFLTVIEGSLGKIANNPLFYPLKAGTFREYVVPKFPFVIVFELLEDEQMIYVLHVFNTNRNPEKKSKQILG